MKMKFALHHALIMVMMLSGCGASFSRTKNANSDSQKNSTPKKINSNPDSPSTKNGQEGIETEVGSVSDGKRVVVIKTPPAHSTKDINGGPGSAEIQSSTEIPNNPNSPSAIGQSPSKVRSLSPSSSNPPQTKNQDQIIEERIALLKYFISLRDGVSASQDPTEISKARDRFLKAAEFSLGRTEVLVGTLEKNKLSSRTTGKSLGDPSMVQNCLEYSRGYQSLVGDIIKYDEKIYEVRSQEDSVMARARIEILRGFLDQMSEITKNGREAGFLDEYTKMQCPYSGRDLWSQSIINLAKAYREYFTLKFGIDAVIDAEFLRKLEVAKDDIEARKKLIRTGYLIGSTVLSIAFWELAVVRGVVLLGQAANLSMAAVRTLQVTLLVGEGMGFLYLDRSFYPEYYKFKSPETMSHWRNFQNELNEFLDLKFKSPSEYAQYIWAADKSRLEWLLEFLGKRGPDLINAEKHWGSLEAALEHHLQLKVIRESATESPEKSEALP
jgi:hypothetical protein